MKKTLLYIIGAAIISFVLLMVWWMNTQEYKVYRALRLQGSRTSATLTEVSYLFNEDGKIVTEPASSLVDLKINGSDQPLRTKAPFSFTLTWKIDPRVELNSCQLYGPNYREGYRGDIWLNGGYGEVKTHEGFLRFENVVPGSQADNYATAPLYHGFASFSYTGKLNSDELSKIYGDSADYYVNSVYMNSIYMGCDDPVDPVKPVLDQVDIWIDR